MLAALSVRGGDAKLMFRYFATRIKAVFNLSEKAC